jgi:methionine synthase II (cobalamin-independent)
MEPFFADLGRAYTKAVRAFGEAGRTYLQLDEVYVADLCDEAQRGSAAAWRWRARSGARPLGPCVRLAR